MAGDTGHRGEWRTPRRLSAIAATVLALSAAVLHAAPDAGGMADPAWSTPAAQGLRAAIDAVTAEGLDPRDYAPDALDRAIRAGEPAALSAAATTSYRMLARDLIQGHVRAEARRDWHVAGPVAEIAAIDRMMAAALASGRVGPELAALAPATPNIGRCARRWPRRRRAMPRGSRRCASTWSAGAGCRVTWGRGICW
ncbi:hypothetical protein GVO57_05955 [Sphingomonas changnyeongensis]|uniref:L,D-transpeptidase scaffold domain-containing protein n=1 Tax=Sphingomonas changnyeongensis TaxID=2698679 RepID=A0A7Z2NW52_9SPHN|nr:hypothetical protein [Sphingomonas changnyeongensis]QHL90460.1 hypothetical protein GVO57_05955 [Sphingomonas changnyeongensis]